MLSATVPRRNDIADIIPQDRHAGVKDPQLPSTALHTRFTPTGMVSAGEHQSCISAADENTVKWTRESDIRCMGIIYSGGGASGAVSPDVDGAEPRVSASFWSSAI